MLTEHEKSMLMVGLVNRYMTPFAALLVLSAAFLSAAPHRASSAAVALLVVISTLNYASRGFVARYPERAAAIRHSRVVVNYVFDLTLLWIFLPYWPSIWMLFLLTVIAVGAYEDKKALVQHAALLTVMLCLVTWGLGMRSLPELGETAVRVAALWFAGLFTNRLVASLQAP
ncbi:MAG: hypothetical protein HY924_11510 [Elusimicrobia bacterium]|nr:hypothetical protein [Elusimicrobiota bacterium]